MLSCNHSTSAASPFTGRVGHSLLIKDRKIEKPNALTSFLQKKSVKRNQSFNRLMPSHRQFADDRDVESTLDRIDPIADGDLDVGLRHVHDPLMASQPAVLHDSAQESQAQDTAGRTLENPDEERE